jgi:hypothetical protein
MLLVLAGWYVGLFGLHFVPGMERHTGLFMAFALASGLVASGAMMVLGADAKGQLELLPDRIVLGERTLLRQGIAVELSVWKPAPLFTTKGTALVLRGERESLRIGGRDHLLRAAAPDAVTTKVDASMSAPDFVEFLRALELDPDQLSLDTSRDALVIDLRPSTSSASMRTWMKTLALAGAVGVLAGILHVEAHPAALVAIQVATVVVVLGGLVLTFRNSMRPAPPRFRLLVEPGQVALVDARNGYRVDPSTPKPNAIPRFYRYSSRGSSYEFPSVELRWPSRTLVVGVWDTSPRWPTKPERSRKLHYIIGAEEWRRLVRALGLG